MSWTQTPHGWTLGLFARRHIPQDTVILPYTGPIVARPNNNSSQPRNHYLMAAHATRPPHRHVTIDGTPTGRNPNPAGRANYASDASANVCFLDDHTFEREDFDRHNRSTNILLITTRAIAPGIEIRIDYDGDDPDRTYLQLLAQELNTNHATFSDHTYLTTRWNPPPNLTPRSHGPICDLPPPTLPGQPIPPDRPPGQPGQPHPPHPPSVAIHNPDLPALALRQQSCLTNVMICNIVISEIMEAIFAQT